jgi:hypothetical protein
MKNPNSRIINRGALLTLLILFLPIVVVSQVSPLRTMQYTSRNKNEAEKWQKELRINFSGLLKMNDLIGNSKSIPFNPKEIKSENKGKYILKEVEISSTAGRRITVVLTMPVQQKGPLPAVVCIHGHGGELYSVYKYDTPYKGFANELANSGYITIATTVSQHNIFEKERTLMGERLWDLMRCVDYLESLKETDRSRIGCAGLSLGGEMAMWLGAMDTRIKADVSCGFLTKMDQMETGHCMCWKFPGLRELVDYADIYSMIAPRFLQCENGLKEPATDFTVPLAREALKEIQLIYNNYNKPENVSLLAHPEGHVVDVPGLLSFLNTNL